MGGGGEGHCREEAVYSDAALKSVSWIPSRNPDLARYASTYFDVVDRPGLRLVEDLQRRVSCIEQRAATAVVLKIRDLVQAQGISKERSCSIKVLNSDDESHFLNSHDGSSRNGPADIHRDAQGLLRQLQLLALYQTATWVPAGQIAEVTAAAARGVLTALTA